MTAPDQTGPSQLFLPWVRRGAATAVLEPDTSGAAQAGVGTATASLVINQAHPVTVPVTVMGPGHVASLDRRQVVRTDPAPGSRTFEPNFFPLVELDEPSLPWLFTPAAPGAQARLRPWLCLVVVRRQAGVRLDPPAPGPLPVLRIAAPAEPAVELPDLAESWAWAHASVTTTAGTSAEELAAELAQSPERSVARLLCARLLAPDTDYLACLVPAFDLGRRTGLGLDIRAEDEARLAPAWDIAATSVELPVYHSWEFATGAGGDFQSLALLLRARSLPAGVGVRPVDVSHSGLAVSVPAQTTVPMPGALVPLDLAAPAWPTPALQTAWETALTPVLDAAATVSATADPLLAPPLYGAAQSGLTRVDPAQPHRWFEQLNLAPWYRAIAHLGARVVQTHQDALVASAWAQSADLARANQLLRQSQLGCHVTASLHTRHLARMDAATGLQVLAPAQPRMTRPPAASAFVATLNDTGLAPSAYGTALRRLARPRGAINRRLQRVTASPDGAPAMHGILLSLQPEARARRHIAFPSTTVSLETVGSRLDPPRFDVTWGGATADAVTGEEAQPWFQFSALGAPVPMRRPPGVPPGQWPDSPAAASFRAAAARFLAAYNPILTPTSSPPMLTGSLAAAFTEALVQTTPATAFAARARAAVSLPGPARSDAGALDPVHLAPRFPQPMVGALTEIAQDAVLPGLEHVPPNTVVPLAANLAFVQAYLVGLNTEMGRELLWREFPVDLSATFFDRFWDAAASPGRPGDIPPIASWGTRSLGAAEAPGQRFVMLVRSELLRRYPDAVIYATKGGVESDPIFTGGFAPDVRYVGFDIDAAEIADWSFVVQEHPSAPRFGIDAGGAAATASHLAAPGTNSAQVAENLRRMPVRLTIPASVLLRSG